ncbi:MAG: hypothetical protein IPJ79_20010 [Bacteroidetes bacterium]|nr:hypothetical protein [Bacteroidota bacterium]
MMTTQGNVIYLAEQGFNITIDIKDFNDDQLAELLLKASKSRCHVTLRTPLNSFGMPGLLGILPDEIKNANVTFDFY